jgi:hypothetical protein
VELGFLQTIGSFHSLEFSPEVQLLKACVMLMHCVYSAGLTLSWSWLDDFAFLLLFVSLHRKMIRK